MMSPEEAKYDENLTTAELRSFLELLESKGSSIQVKELEGPRAQVANDACVRCSCSCAIAKRKPDAADVVAESVACSLRSWASGGPLTGACF
jgi:hypothetical protein